MRVELIDMMGSDKTVVNCARVSFAKEVAHFRENEDGPLIKFLAREEHWSPFGHVQLQFRIKAPIFVARQLVKHQVGFVWNEISRRYVDVDVEFHEPYFWRKRAPNKKQGSLDEPVEEEDYLNKKYFGLMQEAQQVYEDLLAKGVAPEQARIVLPHSLMTEWIWTGSLYGFARVVRLRTSKDAQFECRAVAERIKNEIKNLDRFKYSWEALCQ